MLWEDERGFLLHTMPYGETSLIVDLYTRLYGRVKCIAKGYRRPKKRGANRLLIPYVEYSLCWSGRSDLKTLISADILGPPIFLKEEALYFGLYVNELIYRLFLEQDPLEGFYDHYKQFIDALFKGTFHESHLRKTEMMLLSELGYGLVLDSEADSGEPLEPNGRYLYEPEFGLKKVSHKNAKNVLMGRHILAMPDDDWSNPSVIKTARQILKAAIDFYLGGKQLHSRKLYRDFKVSKTLF